jgi:alpha-beta hydrolase superfamily lysophospholipase
MTLQRKGRIAAISLTVPVLLILAAAAIAQRSKPQLSRWHTTTLKAEFRASDLRGSSGWAEYLALEDRLFRELDEKIARPSLGEANPMWNRYAPDGVNNPQNFPRNWNRTYELSESAPRGGALLIHGLTDSPFSLRSTAEILHRNGFHVLGLRLPGHGTTPLALKQAEVEDWRAAVRIAYEHLVGVVVDGPVILVGYSNGGALSLDLALDSVSNNDLRIPDQIVLYSPAIGITRAAALARLPRLLNWMPWFSKLGWGSVEPELDPFKYSSFPNDAGYLTHVLTTSVRARLAEIEERGLAGRFPPVLTFMSLADATVMVEAVVEGLHDRLVDQDSELVIFDINRQARMLDFFKTDPAERLTALIARPSTPYRLTVISNVDETSDTLEEWSRAAQAIDPVVTPLDLEWPPGFYSLSHVAVPFPPDDPIYGITPDPDRGWGVQLGALEPRGERGLLNLPAGQFNRLRSNPFFPYIEQRLLEVAAGEANISESTKTPRQEESTANP